jgi:hypothetical protein
MPQEDYAKLCAVTIDMMDALTADLDEIRGGTSVYGLCLLDASRYGATAQMSYDSPIFSESCCLLDRRCFHCEVQRGGNGAVSHV